MDAWCSVCHSREGEFKCRQCRKPVCDECSFKIDLGAFCSRKCANQFRDFHRSQARIEKGSRFSLARFILVLIALGAGAVLVAWWQGWLPRRWTSRLNKGAETMEEKVDGAVNKISD